MTSKYEQLIELFIAEDEQGAKDLFHEIVVEKSRDIYEGLTDEDQVEESEEIKEYYIKSADDVLNTYPLFSYRESNPSVDTLYKVFEEWLAKGNELTPDQIEALDQAAEEIEYVEPNSNENREMLKKQYKVLSDITKGSKTESVEESDFDEAELGGDAADDMIDDIEADEEGLSMEDEHEGDDDMEDRVVDLEDALDELKAEFEALMGADDADDDAMDMDMDMDMDMGDEEGEEEEEMEAVEEETEEMVREYTEKAPAPVTSEEGDGSSGPVAGKNDMGGKAVDPTGEEKGGATPKSTVQTDASDTRGATMSKA